MHQAPQFELNIVLLPDARYRVALLRYDEIGGDISVAGTQVQVELVAGFFQGFCALRHDPLHAGAWLREHLVVGVLGNAFQQAFGASIGAGRLFRLRLCLEDAGPELQRLPWELLLPSLDELFGATAHVAFSRFIVARQPRRTPLPPRAPLRALVVTASPSDGPVALPAIDSAVAYARVQEALGTESQVMRLPQMGGSTLERLAEALVRQANGTLPDMLCLIAHGEYVSAEQTFLYLERPDGTMARVPADALITIIQQAAELPRLVILGSCESAGDGSADLLQTLGAQLIQLGVPMIVAMQGQIGVETFTVFLRRFLRELAHTNEVDRAMALARGSLQGQFADWWMPVLLQSTYRGHLWAADNAEVPKSVLGWLQSLRLGPRLVDLKRLTQAILACFVVYHIDWTDPPRDLDALLDEIEACDDDAAACAALYATMAEVLPTFQIRYQDARALRSIVREVQLRPSDMHDLYGRIKPRGEQWNEPPASLAATVTRLVFAPLDYATQRHPLVLLASQLLDHYTNFVSNVAPVLRAWLAQVAPQFVPNPSPLAPMPREAYVQIRIRAGRKLAKQQRFSCIGWLRYDDDRPERPQDCSFGDQYQQWSRRDLPKAFRNVMQEALRALSQQRVHDLRIEVFVPQDLLLDLEIDQWLLDFGTNGSLPAGMQYQLVVRVLERIESERVDALGIPWRQKWEGIPERKQHLADTVFSWFESSEAICAIKFSAQLLNRQVVAVAQTNYPVQDTQTILNCMIGAGIPVALLLRPRAALPDTRRLLEERLANTVFSQLPETVREERCKAASDSDDPFSHLTLLWDDPERLPPMIQFSNVE